MSPTSAACWAGRCWPSSAPTSSRSNRPAARRPGGVGPSTPQGARPPGRPLPAAGAAAGPLSALSARGRPGGGQRVDIAVQQSVTPAPLSFIAAAAVGHEGYTLTPRPVRPPSQTDGEPPLRGPKWRVADGLVEL